MATNKDKEKEQEQLQEQGQENQEQEGNTSLDPIEEAKKKAQAILDEAKTILDAANTEAAKIVKNGTEAAEKIKAEAEAAAMQAHSGDTETTEEETDPMEELVDYIAPLIVGKEDQAIFVQVNGENIRIQRGKKVRIKRKFKEVLDQSAEQEMAAYAFMEKVQRDSAKAAADLN